MPLWHLVKNPLQMPRCRQDLRESGGCQIDPPFVLAAFPFGTQGTVSLGSHLSFSHCLFFLVGCGEILCNSSPNELESKMRGSGNIVKSLRGWQWSELPTYKCKRWAGERVQEFRILAAFPEDPDPFPEPTWWLPAICNAGSWESIWGPHLAPAGTRHTCSIYSKHWYT